MQRTARIDPHFAPTGIHALSTSNFDISTLSGKARIKYIHSLDAPDRITDDLTFIKLWSLLKGGDDGEIADLVQLWEEMQAKDARLRSVVETRLNALTKLDWEIVPNSDGPGKDKDAERTAAYVRQQLGKLESFDPALRTMAVGMPVNLAVLELIWKGMRLINIKPVPHSRYVVDYDLSPNLRLHDEAGDKGFIPNPSKFLVHVPDRSGTNPWTNTLAISQAPLWLAKKLVWVDWNHFAEVFGMPIRMGSYTDNTSDADKKNLLAALKSLGTDAYGIKHVNSMIEIIEAGSRSDQPYAGLTEYAERNQSIGLTGGNLTTDTTGGTGTFAAAKVQNLIRIDLLKGDAKAERHSVEHGLFKPMLDLRYPTQRNPLPEFRRKIVDEVDITTSVASLDGAQRIGLPVTKGEAYRKLDITPPEGSDLDAIVDYPDPAAGGFGAFSEALIRAGGNRPGD